MRHLLPIVLLVAGCASPEAEVPADPAPATVEQPRTVQPGAPGEATAEAELDAPTEPSYTEADVAFMQAMLPHHAQALVMTELVPERAGRDVMRFLAERIEVSQETEIAMMRRWLRERGEEVPSLDWRGHGGMHGMATPEELARLEEARGEAFDRLFLQLMIRHHQGALRMVRELRAVEGAAQGPEIFQFITHVDADQRAEIERMRRLLNDLQ